MTTLKICLLGGFELRGGDEPLPPPATLKARSLLAYLVTYRERSHPRERLADLFWPERPRDRALRSLSTALWHVRRVLPPGDYILADAQTVRFNPHSDYWLDVEEFASRMQDARCKIQDARCRIPVSCLLPLASCIQLYRGDFLEGFYDDWCLEERYRLEGLYLQALEQLVVAHQALDQPEEALHYAGLLLARDPLREDVHRRAIRLHVRLGNRVEAVRHARWCRAVLRTELGVEPAPETVALCDELLGLAWRRGPGEGALAQRGPPPRSQPALVLERPPFVGREAEWGTLLAHWERARSGRGHLVLMSGEAGIGKTRLVEELGQHVRQRGGWVACGRCYEYEHALPHGPLADLLRAVLAATGARVLERLPLWQAAELTRLAPELGEQLPPPPSSPPREEGRGGEPTNQEQARLFDALTLFLLDLARQNPLLLVLEDLHWAHDSTLAWLHYLARRLPQAPVLLVATCQREEVGPNHTLHGLALQLQREGLATRLELARLPQEALGHWMVGASDALVARIYRQTEGNPFFTLETLRALFEEGRVWPVGGRWVEETAPASLPIPASVRQVVQMRLGRLSLSAREATAVVAVVGRTFDFGVLEQAWGQGEEATLEALDELLRRRLVREGSGPSARDYEFDHHLVREVIYRGLHYRRRQRLHRLVGEAMERLYAGQPDAPGEVAHHFDAGGETTKALHYYDLAVRKAEALFAWQDAERYLGRMLDLLDRLDPDRTRADCLAQRGQVLVDRAQQRHLQGRLAERDADLSALAALAEASHDENLRRQALIYRVRYLNLGGQYREAIAMAEEGLALADRLGDASAHCRLLAHIGFAHYFLGQPQPALAALESALVEAGEEAGPEMRGRITHFLGYVYLHLGNYARSLAYQQEAYVCNLTVGDHNRIAWNLLDTGFLHLKLRHFAAAEEHLIESLALARRIHARPAEAYALTYLGYWELYRGRYVAAADRFRQALPIQQAVHSEHGVVAAEVGWGLAFYHLGDYAEARRRLESAAERARSVAHRRRLAEALIGLGLVEMAAGQPLAAHRRLTEAVALARESECQENLAAGLAALARAERHRGDPGSALKSAVEAVRVAQESKLPVCEMWGEMETGLALLAQGDPVAALEHTERAVALVPQAHEGWIGTEQAHQAHAQALRVLGRIQEAEEQERWAVAIVEAKANRIPDPEQRQRYLEEMSVNRQIMAADIAWQGDQGSAMPPADDRPLPGP